MARHPSAGANLRGAQKNPGALPGEKRKEGGDRDDIARPGRECPSRVAEHRAEKSRASVHDARVDDTIEAVVLELAGSALNVPIGYAGRTCPADRR